MEILFNCFLLIIGGQETTRNATSGGMMALIENPGQRERLTRDRSLLPTAVEEVLRYTSPITHLMRTATQRYRDARPDIKAGSGGDLERVGQPR